MTSPLAAWMHNERARRAVTVPVVATAAAALGATVGIWAPIAGAIDLATDRTSMTRLRLLSFALAWTTLESIGVGAATTLWATGRAGDRDAHYALQRWWAARLVDALHTTAGMTIEVDGQDRLAGGPIVLCARHASIADSLLPAWLLGRSGMRPRYVLKDELLLDPCLDIVGNRLPNHFVDRDPDDNRAELAHLEALARGMGRTDAAVIFPEGTVVTESRRERAIRAITDRDPERGARVRTLRTLGPVRPGGTAALLRGAPTADLVLVNHTGFDQLQRLADAPATVPLVEPIRVAITRIPRSQIPAGDDFVAWLDARWGECDDRMPASSRLTRPA